MSFIGNVPAEAYSPVAKDTFSGDDSTTDFTLSIPATTNGVEVLVENVQQEPTTAYTISGTTLSFTAAPVTGTNNIYVIHRGPAVQTVVPPAGVALNPSTVDATGDISTEGDLKVETTSGGIYTITGTDTATNRTLTLPDEAGTVLTSGATDLASTVSETQVAFQVIGSNIDQSVSTGAWRLVQFNSTDFDSHSGWDGTNYRYVAPVAGWYLFGGAIRVEATPSDQQFISLAFNKNGATGKPYQTQYQFNADLITNGTLPLGSAMLYLNGSTDFVEVNIYVDETINISDNAGSYSWFNGFLVRAA